MLVFQSVYGVHTGSFSTVEVEDVASWCPPFRRPCCARSSAGLPSRERAESLPSRTSALQRGEPGAGGPRRRGQSWDEGVVVPGAGRDVPGAGRDEGRDEAVGLRRAGLLSCRARPSWPMVLSGASLWGS